jgi:hypothetical protein
MSNWAGGADVKESQVQVKHLKTIKSQIASTKLQINLKLQYLMTETVATFVLHHFSNPVASMIMPVSKIVRTMCLRI